MNRLYTIDTKAINHVLMNSYIYQKPEGAKYNLSRIVGNGVLVVEGDKHKQQVHLPFGKLSLIVFTVLSAENNGNIHSFTTCFCFSETSHQNPAFGAAQIRELTEIFVEKSIQVRIHFISTKSDLNNIHIASFAIYGLRKVAKKDQMGALTYYRG
jgi:hypothetical protein